ncbi:MAG: AraC family transcriptional regulator [Bacteroidota bacterium]
MAFQPNETVFTPKAPLNKVVKAIWVGKADDVSLRDRNRAMLLTELVFNYGDTYTVTGENIWSASDGFSDKILSGLKTSPFELSVNGKYSNIGIILQPYCYRVLYEVFHSPDLSLIADILFEHLILADNPRFDIAEKLLVSHFDQWQLDDDLLKFEKYVSFELIKKGHLADFNSLIPISQKSFISKFKKNYLISPSQYIRLRQVDYAVNQMHQSNDNLTILGLRAGFYDQSHFIRAFKKFCGVTPSCYKKSISKVG